DGRPPDHQFSVRRYGRRAARLARLGDRWRVAAMIGAARTRRRHLDDPTTLTIVIGLGVDPVLASALCGPGDWLFCAFGPRRASPASWYRSAVALAARFAARRRVRHGGAARVAVPSSQWTA